MERPLPTLLLLGNVDHPEMQIVAGAVGDLVPASQQFHSTNFAGIQQVLTSEGVFPDVVLVCQTWPDEFTRSEVAQLFERFPLAAILCCFGSWCDSDGRTRDRWPAATRVSAATAAPLIRRVWQDAAAGRAPLPATAAIEDVFERQHGGTIAGIGRNHSGHVGIYSADPAIRSWLSDALSAAGFEAADTECEQPPTPVAVWDAPVWDDRAEADLKRFRAAHEATRLLVLIGGLRPHQAQQARKCGADCVLPKLMPIDAILTAIAQLVRGNRTTRPLA